MLTLADCRDPMTGIADIAGCCTDTFKFSSLINQATSNLLRRGDWSGTVVPIQVCVKRGCIVWPRYVLNVRKISLCSNALPVHNLWYQFLPRDVCGTGWRKWGHGECALFANGHAPTYSSVYGDGRLIRAYPRTLDDLGKTIRIFGVDNGNQPLKTNNGDGTWSEGIVITLGRPYGSTSVYVRRIDRVVKEVTQGQVLLYAYDVVNDILEDLAIYDPGETTPSYARYQLGEPSNRCGNQPQGCCGTSLSVVALVKLRFIPAKFDTDLILVDNADAIKLAVQAIKCQDAGDREGYKENMIFAVNTLNRQLEDESPDDQFSSENETFGGGVSYSQKMF